MTGVMLYDGACYRDFGRNMAETVITYIRAFSSLKLPRCGSPANVLIQLTDYQLNPIQTHNHRKITAS